MLEARNLWRFFGERPAVQGLDMDVAAGSAYGFVGANGAGKTTTLRLLSTLDRPTAGTIRLDGHDAHAEMARVRPLIGFMPDPFELYDDLSVEEHLAFFAQAYGLPRADRSRRVEAAIHLARVSERRRQKCGGLSKGWKQRVLLAKTLVHDPKLLLLDEPAAGLDPAARIEFRAIVRELRELGKAIVVSSHILTELADFCDSVGIVEKGRMLVSGRIDDILGRLDPTTRIDVEVLGERETAIALLRARPEVVSVQPGELPGTVAVRARLGNDAPALRASMLETLMQNRVRVAAFSARREGLEDLFLRVAAGRGSSPAERKALLGILGVATPSGRAEAASAPAAAAAPVPSGADGAVP